MMTQSLLVLLSMHTAHAYLTHVAGMGDSLSVATDSKADMTSAQCIRALEKLVVRTQNYHSDDEHRSFITGDTHDKNGRDRKPGEGTRSIVELYNEEAQQAGRPPVPASDVRAFGQPGATIMSDFLRQARALGDWMAAISRDMQLRNEQAHMLVVVMLGGNDVCGGTSDSHPTEGCTPDVGSDSTQASGAAAHEALNRPAHCWPETDTVTRAVAEGLAVIYEDAAYYGIKVNLAFIGGFRLPLMCEEALHVKPVLPFSVFGSTCSHVHKSPRVGKLLCSPLLVAGTGPGASAEHEASCAPEKQERMINYITNVMNPAVSAAIASRPDWATTATLIPNLSYVYMRERANPQEKGHISPCDCFHPIASTHAAMAKLFWDGIDCGGSDTGDETDWFRCCAPDTNRGCALDQTSRYTGIRQWLANNGQ